MFKQFFKDSFIYSFSNLLTMGFGIIMMPFYTKSLSTAEYGVIDMVSVVQTFVAIFLGLEITQAIPKFYGEMKSDNGQVSRFVSTCFTFTGLGGLVVFILANLFSQQLSLLLFKTTAFSAVIKLAGLSFALSRVFQVFVLFLRNRGESLQISLFSILSSVITLTLTILFVLYVQLGVLGVFLANSIALVVVCLVIYVKYKVHFMFVLDKELLRKALRFSFPLVWSVLSVSLLAYTDRLVINKYLGLDMVGVFGVAYRISSVVNVVLMGFTTAIVPLVYSNYSNPETPGLIEKIFRYFLFIVFLLMLFTILFSETIISTFTTKDYQQAGTVLPYLLLVNLLSSVGYFFPGLFLSGKTKTVALINIFSAVLNVVLNLVLVTEFGIIGSAVSSVISSLLSVVLTIWLSQLSYKIPYNWKSYLGLVSIFLLVYSLPYSRFLLSVSYPKQIVTKICVLLCFTTIVFLLKFISVNELQLLKQKFMKKVKSGDSKS